MMRFEFWLDTMLLPVTPREYSLEYANEMEMVRVSSVGDIVIPTHRRLQTISLRSFFTVKSYVFANNSRYSNAMEFVRQIEKWIDAKKKVRLVIADQNTTKVNQLFYIESIQYGENAITAGDIDYTITLQSSQSIAVKQMVSETVRAAPESVKSSASSYTVVAGDYLRKIARQFYGDANAWKRIYDSNRQVIGGNPNLIYAGQVLTIP